MVIRTYTEAIQTVDPQLAFGKASDLWIDFAHFYEEYADDIANANAVFAKAAGIKYGQDSKSNDDSNIIRFKQIDELASIYCAWAEMHIRHRNYESALLIMKHACCSSVKLPKNKSY